MLYGFHLNSNSELLMSGNHLSVLWPWLLPLKKKKKVTLTLPAAAADNCPMRRETHPPAAMSAYQPMQKTLTTSHSLCQVASNKGTTHSAMGLFDFFT